MPEQEEKLSPICYLTNFLSSVIFRLDFSEILSLSTNPPDKFQDKIREQFPGTETKDLIQITTGLKEGNEVFSNKKVTKTYFFSNKEKNQQIEINPAHFAVVFSKYTTYEQFVEIVKNAFRYFNDLYKPLDLKRIGLRFVNEIKIPQGNPLEWENLIDAKLIANINTFENIKENLSRTMSQMVFKYDDYSLVFNCGIFNQEFPGKISRKEFILDYDCYTLFGSVENIDNYLNIFHKQIQSLFEMSIKDELRKVMEPI